MWNGKRKAITFSFDDGCQQDIRLVELLNKYHLKATFNLNSGLAGLDMSFPMFNKMIKREIVKLEDIKKRYQGHEIAGHSYMHPALTLLSKEECREHIVKDKALLEEYSGQKLVGFAYPGGSFNEQVIEVLKEAGYKYARPATAGPCVNPGFNLPKKPYEWHMFYWLDPDVDFDVLIDNFLENNSDLPQILAIWGHSYELDAYDGLYEKWDRLFAKLANCDDVFYGTNRECLDL